MQTAHQQGMDTPPQISKRAHVWKAITGAVQTMQLRKARRKRRRGRVRAHHAAGVGGNGDLNNAVRIVIHLELSCEQTKAGLQLQNLEGAVA